MNGLTNPSLKTVLFFLLLVTLLGVNLFLRFSQYDYPIDIFGGDGNRDYFVAHHIITYHEYPLVGPYNGGSDNIIKNSPFYFYLLAFILLFHDTVLFLGQVNIVFQVISLLLFFIFAKKTFGIVPAFITLLFLTFTPEIMHHSKFVWQPYVMEPFFTGSLLTLLIAYQKKNIRYSIFGNVLFITAAILHNSVCGLIPPLLVVDYFTLKSRGQKHFLRDFVLLLLFLFLLLGIFYLPVIIYLVRHNFGIIPSDSSILSSFVQFSPDKIITNFGGRFLTLMRLLGIPANPPLFTFDNLLFLMLPFFCVVYFLFYKGPEKKISFLLLTGIGTFLFLISCMQKQQFHTLTPIMEVTLLLIVNCIYKTFLLFPLPRIFLLLYIFLFFNSILNTFSLNYQYLSPPTNKQIIDDAATTVIPHLLKSHIKNVAIVGYRTGSHYLDPTILINPLEQKLHRELLPVTDTFYGYSSAYLRSQKYIILICADQENHYFDRRLCQQAFKNEYRGFSIEEKMYSRGLLTIYLAIKQ